MLGSESIKKTNFQRACSKIESSQSDDTLNEALRKLMMSYIRDFIKNVNAIIHTQNPIFDLMQFDILIYSFELRKRKMKNVSLYHNSCVVVIHLIEIVKKA